MITYSDYQVGTGVNAFMVFVPLFNTEHSITLEQFSNLEYIKEYQHKMCTMFTNGFLQALHSPQIDTGASRSCFTQGTRGYSRSGTGRIEYLVFVRCLKYNPDNDKVTLDPEEFTVFCGWYANMMLASKYIQIPYKLEGLLDDDEWYKALNLMQKEVLSHEACHFNICKKTVLRYDGFNF